MVIESDDRGDACRVAVSSARPAAARPLAVGTVNSILPHYARQIGKIFNYISLNIELYHSKLQFCIVETLYPWQITAKCVGEMSWHFC